VATLQPLCGPRHRCTVDRNVPNGLDLHLVVDNHATHKHAKVKALLYGIKLLPGPTSP
jgi:hypothetical protein